VRAVLAEPETSTTWLEVGRAAFDRRFAEAADIFARMPFRPAEAHARVRAAEQLVAEGRRTEADEQLQRTLSLWRSVGATRYIRQAEKLLPATA
jgi:thioredoxin-like negative regulator of GroEL